MILIGKSAEEFVKKAESAIREPRIDFSKEMEVMKRILQKAQDNGKDFAGN